MKEYLGYCILVGIILFALYGLGFLIQNYFRQKWNKLWDKKARRGWRVWSGLKAIVLGPILGLLQIGMGIIEILQPKGARK